MDLRENKAWQPYNQDVGQDQIYLLWIKSGFIEFKDNNKGNCSVFGDRILTLDEINFPILKYDGEAYYIPPSLPISSFDTIVKSLTKRDNRRLMIVFSSKSYDEYFFETWIDLYKDENIRVRFNCATLDEKTIDQCQGASILCLFVNDKITESMALELARMGVELIALRCAGTNNVDLEACKKQKIKVMNVPAYGPNSVAEHALALIMTLNRKIHLLYDRIKTFDFSLNIGLLGFEMAGKTVGIIGTGRIGSALAKVLSAMECRVLCHDVVQNPNLSGLVNYVDLETMLKESKIISLHIPLRAETHHLINKNAFELMQRGSILINTSRGGLVDTAALIEALKSGHLGGAGLDVYEAESGQFYADMSREGLKDDVLARLITFPNVIVTSHQGYFTKEAMETIAKVTFENVTQNCK